MNFKRVLSTAITTLFLLSNIQFGQQYGKGLLMDEESFQNNAKSVSLMRGDYRNLPVAVSLKPYTPTPGSQGAFGTCTGWSSAYAGRTILEAIRHKWDQSRIDSNVFSPSYIYNQIKIGNDCYGGASIIDALDVLKDQGGLKMNDFGYDCDLMITDQNKKDAEEYTIIEYREVADKNSPDKIVKVKKSISELKPVVIALDCPDSFYDAKELWKPKKSDYKLWSIGHALCVIGYDDNKFGGAFEVMNSWSTEWGNDGFTWIKYDDFQYFCLYAFELLDKVVHEEFAWDLSGSLKFVDSNNKPMRCKVNGDIFEMEQAYSSGTLFELFVSNNQPAYVYAFGTDTTNITYKIFPFHNQMTAYLPYSQNNFAIPDEGSFTMLDETPGITYYCFLYSNKELDIDRILERFENYNRSFLENITFALGDKMVDTSNSLYKDGEIITFKAKSSGKNVLPVLIKINHF